MARLKQFSPPDFIINYNKKMKLKKCSTSSCRSEAPLDEQRFNDSHCISDFLAPRGRPLRLIALITVLCTASNFTEGYSNTYPNTAVNSFYDFINTSYVQRGSAVDGLSESLLTWLWSATLNIWFFGAAFGSLLTPLLADKLGRRTALLISNGVGLLGALLSLVSVLTALPELFIFSRIVASTSAGISFGVLVLFTQETAPTSLRGVTSFLSESTFLYMAAIGMAFGMDAIFGRHLPLLTGVAIIPCALAILLTLPLHETPKHLIITRGKRTAALRSLQYYQGVRADDEATLDEMLLEAEQSSDVSRSSDASRSNDDASRSSDSSRSCSDASKRQSLLRVAIVAFDTPHLRRAFLLGVACQQVVMCMWPLIYLSTDLLSERFSLEVAQLASLGFVVVSCVASIAGAFLIERIGRRSMMLWLGGVQTLGLVGYIAFELVIPAWPASRFLQLASLAAMGIAYGLGLGPVSLFITSELVPQLSRAVVQSMQPLTVLGSTKRVLPEPGAFSGQARIDARQAAARQAALDAARRHGGCCGACRTAMDTVGRCFVAFVDAICCCCTR